MRRVLVLGLVAVMVSGGALAYAKWTGGGQGSGKARATTIDKPINVAANASGPTSVTVTWGAPTTGAPPVDYLVRRVSPAATVCTVAPPAALSCVDTGRTANTTYSYTVESRRTNWVSGQTTAVSATTSAAFGFATTNPLVLANRSTPTAGTAGTIENGDSITVTFNRAPDPASVCTGWTGAAPLTATVTAGNNNGTGGNDTLTFGCTGSQFGSLDLGRNNWFSSAVTYGSSTLSLSGSSLVLVLAGNTTGTLPSQPSQSVTITYAPGTIKDLSSPQQTITGTTFVTRDRGSSTLAF